MYQGICFCLLFSLWQPNRVQNETEKEESTQNKKKKAKDGPHFQMRKRESVFGTEKVAQMKAGGMSVTDSHQHLIPQNLHIIT